ncbi:hypothetical protein HMPREF3189_01624 [Clostridiales bacterium KA00134]|nr:hypothetical protein HMPREF3189_01624 [Clostridiales bacterium KA00134]
MVCPIYRYTIIYPGKKAIQNQKKKQDKACFSNIKTKIKISISMVLNK